MITDPSFRSGLLNSIRNTRATLLRTDLLGPQLDSLQEMDNPESTYFLTTQSDSLFASLPTEIVLKICFQLDVAALVAIAKTCSLFWNIVKDETLWKHRIKHDYLLIPDVCLPSKREKNSSGSSITARCYYTHFLHSIGKCVGIWWQKSDGVSTRGGLLHIRFEGPDLVCDKITPSKIFRDDPIKSKYFFAKLDDLSLNIIFQCFMGRKLYSIQLSEEGNTLMTEVEKRLGQNGRPTNGGQRGGIHDCSDKWVLHNVMHVINIQPLQQSIRQCEKRLIWLVFYGCDFFIHCIAPPQVRTVGDFPASVPCGSPDSAPAPSAESARNWHLSRILQGIGVRTCSSLYKRWSRQSWNLWKEGGQVNL